MRSGVSCVLCLMVFSSEFPCVSVHVLSVCLHVFVCFCAADVCLFHSFDPDFFGRVGWEGMFPARACVCVRQFTDLPGSTNGGDTPPRMGEILPRISSF